jgi:hypothetical protein
MCRQDADSGKRSSHRRPGTSSLAHILHEHRTHIFERVFRNAHWAITIVFQIRHVQESRSLPLDALESRNRCLVDHVIEPG